MLTNLRNSFEIIPFIAVIGTIFFLIAFICFLRSFFRKEGNVFAVITVVIAVGMGVFVPTSDVYYRTDNGTMAYNVLYVLPFLLLLGIGAAGFYKAFMQPRY